MCAEDALVKTPLSHNRPTQFHYWQYRCVTDPTGHPARRLEDCQLQYCYRFDTNFSYLSPYNHGSCSSKERFVFLFRTRHLCFHIACSTSRLQSCLHYAIQTMTPRMRAPLIHLQQSHRLLGDRSLTTKKTTATCVYGSIQSILFPTLTLI